MRREGKEEEGKLLLYPDYGHTVTTMSHTWTSSFHNFLFPPSEPRFQQQQFTETSTIQTERPHKQRISLFCCRSS